MKKITFEEVKKRFEDNKCELMENKYINNKTKMRYKCTCGNISSINLNSFTNGHLCKYCGYNKASKNNTIIFIFIA